MPATPENHKNYQCRILVDVDAKVAFENICDVGGWWASNLVGSTKTLGDKFTVRFGKTFGTMQIIELVPNRKITWLVTESYLPLFKNVSQWKNTQLVWEVIRNGGASQITMTHVGLNPEMECYSDCEKGWNFYVRESLFRLLTTKKGLPGTGIFANVSVGQDKYEGLLFYKYDPIPQYADGLLFLDVKETFGEKVIGFYEAGEFKAATFNPQNLRGDYFMIIQQGPFSGTEALYDIQKNRNLI
jgi:hypothetical protein